MFKKSVLLTGFALSILFCGFAQRLKYPSDFAREPGDKIFVITKDGKKHVGKKIKVFYNNPLVKTNVIKLDGEKIYMSDVVSYQDKDVFTKLVNETEDIWAVRIKRGKLNVYTENLSPNDPFQRVSLFIKKDSTQATLCTFQSLEKMISDNQKALDKLNEYFPGKDFFRFSTLKKEYKQINEIFDIYNL